MGKIKKLKHPAKLQKPQLSKNLKGDKVNKAKDKIQKTNKKKLKHALLVEGKESKEQVKNLVDTNDNDSEFKKPKKVKKKKVLQLEDGLYGDESDVKKPKKVKKKKTIETEDGLYKEVEIKKPKKIKKKKIEMEDDLPENESVIKKPKKSKKKKAIETEDKLELKLKSFRKDKMDSSLNDNATSTDVKPIKNDSKSTQNDEENNEKKVRHDSQPQNTIFVGNLASRTKKTQLKSLFAQFGRVVSVRFRTAEGKKLFKHATRKKAESLNAYVVFDNEESKQKALSMSGSEFKGRHIRVTAVKDYTSNVTTKALVYVGNLKYTTTDEKLYEIFSSCGELEYVRTIRHEKGCTGSAFVCFKKPESVTLALELNNSLLDDRPMRVQRYRKNYQPQENQKILTGPARRLAEKKKHMGGSGKHTSKAKNASDSKLKTPKKEKKSDFHGKKISSVKKKPKNKKKLSHLQKLAKKIAPK